MIEDIATWLIPLVSLVVVIEWVVIVWLRRRRGYMPTYSRVALLDVTILLVGVALLISSWQYVDVVMASHPARIALGTIRVILLLLGAHILWTERRDRDEAR